MGNADITTPQITKDRTLTPRVIVLALAVFLGAGVLATGALNDDGHVIREFRNADGTVTFGNDHGTLSIAIVTANPDHESIAEEE